MHNADDPETNVTALTEQTKEQLLRCRKLGQIQIEVVNLCDSGLLTYCRRKTVARMKFRNRQSIQADRYYAVSITKVAVFDDFLVDPLAVV